MPGFTLLLVEDNPEDRILLSDAFRRTAPTMVLRCARDGEEAIDYLRGCGAFADRSASPAPDLVLLDLKLPKKSGFEVLAWIRGSVEHANLPVIVLTSSSEPCDIAQAYALGATSYLVKSIGLRETREMARGLNAYAGLRQPQA